MRRCCMIHSLLFMGFSCILFRVLFICCAALFPYHVFAYPSYESCSPYMCNHSLIEYPFNPCGSATVKCTRNQGTVIYISRSGPFCPEEGYKVAGEITESTYTNRTIRIACDSFSDYCYAPTRRYRNYGLVEDNYDWSDLEFSLSDKYKAGSVLICEKEPAYSKILQRVKCLECRSRDTLCYFLPSQLFPSTSDQSCSNRYGVIIPSNESYNISDEKNLTELLHTGFDVTWNKSVGCTSCEASGGICYRDASDYYYSAYDEYYTPCICSNGPHAQNCSGEKLKTYKDTWWTRIWPKISKYVTVVGAISGVFIISTIIFIYRRNSRKKREQQEEQDIRGYMDPLDSAPPSIENFLQAGTPTRYSYRQIKRYTQNFAMKLGQGGFGTVFKGELPNGCIIAVKTLDKSKHSQIQFLNEVATIGRIHHLHLVRLLGYCLEGSKRALIYEFMINGSLEKYIHEDDQNVLNWKQLYSIAMGTARGIAYLHDDCRNRILHCDIKPHNVLLDANFSAKVADFGLAKLTNREESHVSLTGARGTPGYVAPEVWSRSNGPVTDRSDVYSYGMLLMEMVGGRKNFDMRASRSSKFYYPEWAFKQVEMGEFRNLRGEDITGEEDETIAKKLSMLGLWCIQYNYSHRPSMSRVIQMLEGTVDIVIPPQPFPVDTPVQTSASESSSSM